MNPIFISNTYHPVGQGLFVSGNFYNHRGERRFTWVYDCGALHAQEPLEGQVSCLKDLLQGERINSFVISHFDRDHISGAKRLLTEVGADVVFLPYLPLTDRVQILIEEAADDWYADFLVDPAAHLVGVAGENTRIVLVAGGPDAPEAPPGFDFPDQEEGEDDNYPLEPHYPAGEPVSEADAPTLNARGGAAVASVITHDQTLRLGKLWEFDFYNEARSNRPIPTLQRAVLEILGRHRQPNWTYDGTALLADLRAEYERCFGYGGQNANRISLVMYSGPLVRRGWLSPHKSYRLDFELFFHIHWHSCPWCPPLVRHSLGSIGFGSLLTGDIFFDNEPKIDAAVEHFSSSRWARVDVLQVPHHGSSHSWYKGAAAKFTCRLSVFSAAAQSKHHPGPMVRSDLASRGPTLVSENQGLEVLSWL